MSETPQLYLGLDAGSEEGATGFQGVLNYIREAAPTEYHKGYEFERLMKQYLSIDPLYKERFTDVYMWREWAALHTEYDGVDTGIDLVARESNGEYCAIQCKCFAEDTRVTKPQIDSFVAASAAEVFTKRILVHTGAELGPNVRRAIEPLGSNFQVIGYGHLAGRPIDWPDLRREVPEQLDYRIERFSLRDHQREAFDDVINGFQDSDRGKLIMACGTGKTLTALRIAEKIAGIGGRVLYLVPSIGLFSQAMREWAEQQGVQHRYIGICSDTSAGKKSEDVPIQELEIPVTTDPLKISEALGETDEDAMTVVFCTYHSLPIVESAQEGDAPAFDIILCDEAHRTTGIEEGGDETSPFVLVHNADRIRAKKRLYMTATPRLYTEGAKAKAANHHIDLKKPFRPSRQTPIKWRYIASIVSLILIALLILLGIVLFLVNLQVQPDANAHLMQGLRYSAKGDYDNAIEAYTKAIEIKPGYVPAYALRGLEYSAKGDDDQSNADWAKANALRKAQ